MTLSEVDGSLRADLLRTALNLASNDALSGLIVNQLSPDIGEADGLVRLIVVLTMGPDEPFLLALQRSKAASKLIGLLSSLSTKERLGPEGAYFALCNNIFRIMLCGNGITGTYKAIRLGFLQAYLECSEKLHQVCLIRKKNTVMILYTLQIKSRFSLLRRYWIHISFKR
ncbi:hypothetical protein DL96DRAFT_1631055 [Flagelloscypha sp. PMI_526]|nr:hypothetical protein DL96DRAFT_1631055 [Flagelloscypha sp. PMI_526]